MQLGLSLRLDPPATSPDDLIALAVAAEESGFASVWVPEAYGADAATTLAWIAAATERIGLGSGIFQMPGRSPALTATTSMTLDHLSGGRMMLGLGLSGPQVAEGLHGQPFDRPLARTREYVQLVRQALDGKRLGLDGAAYRVPASTGGRGLRPRIRPRSPHLPLYLAALGPRNLELTGEFADGWLGTFVCPAQFELTRKHLAAGAERAGRPLPVLTCNVPVALDGDVRAARAALRSGIAFHVGAMGSRSHNFYRSAAARMGFGPEAERVQDLYLGGDREAAERAVPDELVDAITLAGPPERVRSRLGVYRDAGIDTVVLDVRGGSTDERVAAVRALGTAR